MTDGNDTLSKRYRELAREEPPHALDAAILAASRREVARSSLSRRWGVPVSIAAVLVLAFGLTLEMQHEKPDVSTSPPAAAEPTMPSALPPGAAPMQAPENEPQAPPREKDVVKPEAKRIVPSPRTQPVPQLNKESAPARERETRDELQAAPASASAPAPASAPAAAPPTAAAGAVVQSPAAADSNAAPARAAPAMRAKSATTATSAVGILAPPTAEQQLESIAKLRSEGNDAEADRLLEEFRRAHPGYQIPEAMWVRVKPR